VHKRLISGRKNVTETAAVLPWVCGTRIFNGFGDSDIYDKNSRFRLITFSNHCSSLHNQSSAQFLAKSHFTP
jgi:hypothetical protein